MRAVFSGCRPPDRASHEVILHTLPDQAFMEEIVKLGGTPVDVFRNKELMTIFTPIIKTIIGSMSSMYFRPRRAH